MDTTADIRQRRPWPVRPLLYALLRAGYPRLAYPGVDRVVPGPPPPPPDEVRTVLRRWDRAPAGSPRVGLLVDCRRRGGDWWQQPLDLAGSGSPLADEPPKPGRRP